MDSVVLQLLEKYNCRTAEEYDNALKEIMQEIALLGLWRSKFFEHGLFYGGTALRILYGLPRFSEDLDFSLLDKNRQFDFSPHHAAIKAEMEAFGFSVTIEAKNKNFDSAIESAFIKASTKVHFMRIDAPEEIASKIASNRSLKIKVEIDTDPPADYKTEVKDLYTPIPFQVKTMSESDLFAGKCHAVLARKWESRVKGRDFFDYLWYLSRQTPLHLKHLQSRLAQSGHWNNNQELSASELKRMLFERFDNVDFDMAKNDVYYFLDERQRGSLALWSKNYFIDSISRIEFR